jgi:hypothetical protein
MDYDKPYASTEGRDCVGDSVACGAAIEELPFKVCHHFDIFRNSGKGLRFWQWAGFFHKPVLFHLRIPWGWRWPGFEPLSASAFKSSVR